MKKFFSKIKYFIPILLFLNAYKINAEDYLSEKISNKENEIIIESNNQRSDLNNSIFYAEGDVLITNTENDFIAKSKKAIINKLTGEIKLIGNVEISNSNSNKVRAPEIIFYSNENKFEAISDLNQRVKTTLVLQENKITNGSKGR